MALRGRCRGCRSVDARVLQQLLLALAILEEPRERPGLARLVRQLPQCGRAEVLLELCTGATADVKAPCDVVSVGNLEDRSATAEAETLAREPDGDWRRCLARDPVEHCVGGVGAERTGG